MNGSIASRFIPSMRPISTFEPGEKVVAMTTWKGVIVIATERAVYVAGDGKKIRKIFPDAKEEK